ncbi:hypothetical protein FRX94_04010 [Corynebacterium canis]|uniref:Peptidase n=1 Tax=Corynebacterium canis TaxID=679663 RepID=A0A5C5UN38_9CORY|nr:DUF5979 domain-containing protein [Corynebacterium canis]TWT26775.1 hypothetical protein FRX94_04010 [Corynebacterium canis]WJY74517.1 hypothetical protein CCANI_03300 [Corynebacterium canis]
MLQLRLGTRAVTTLLAVVTVLFALVVPTAHAQNPLRVEVTSASLIKSDATGVPAAEGDRAQLYSGDVARVSIGFDVLNPADAQPGDTLTVRTPPELTVQPDAPFQLRFAEDAEHPAGSCQPAEQEIVCTLAAGFPEHVAAGELWFLSTVARPTEGTELSFDVNGVPAVAPVPLGVRERPQGFQVQAFDVVSTPILPNVKSIPWSVRFHGGVVAADLGLSFDGATVHTIEFEARPDTTRQVLPAGEEYASVLNTWGLAETNSEADPSQPRRMLAKVGASVADGFEMKVEFTEQGTATIALTGPFRPDANYALSAHMPIRSEFQNRVCGFDYRNDITLLGANIQAKSSPVRCTDAGGGNIALAPGFGGFAISKTFHNPDGVPDDQFLDAEYQVKAKYTFPDDTRAADYQVDGVGYAAPGTLNEAGTGGEVLVALLPQDGRLQGVLDGMLPKGTKVEFSEVLPRVPGIVWKAPVFQPSSLIIESLKTQEVSLSNTIQKIVSETAPVKIFKKVEGDLKNPPQSFDFHVQCEGAADREIRVQVNKETGVGNYEVGKKCTITEKDSSVPAGYRLEKPVTQTVEIPAGGHTFHFMNTYTRDHGKLGHFTLTKVVEADPGLAVPATFDFAYRCEREDTEDIFTGKLEKVLPNTPTQSPGVPEGFSCAVTELNADIDGADLEVLNPGTVKVGEAISVTNVYRRIVPLQGTFTIKKVVKADPGMKTPESFSFDYRCTKPGEQDIVGKVTNVKAGATGSSARVPYGYKCTVTERDASIDGADWTLKVSGEVAAGEVATVTNTYTRAQSSVLRPHSSIPWWLLGIPLLGGLAK